jgi:hypothetical protein
MKNFIFVVILFLMVSCSIQKDNLITEYDPKTMNPRNFDETEIWFDYHHNKPLIDTSKSKIELTNL